MTTPPLDPGLQRTSDEPERQERRGWPEVEQLYERTKIKLVGTLTVMLRSRDDAYDAVQEALIAAAASIEQLGKIDSADAWFTTIAIRKGLDKLRQRSRRPTILRGTPADLAVFAEQAELSGKFEVLGIAEGAAPEDRLIVAEALDFLSTLPYRQRSAYLMRHFLGMTPTDIADVLGCAIKHVSTYVGRAQHALEDRFINTSRGTGRWRPTRPQGGGA